MATTDTKNTAYSVSGEPDLQRSSCSIKTSVRGTDIDVKVYAGSPVAEACDEAMTHYRRVFDDMEAWLLGRRQQP